MALPFPRRDALLPAVIALLGVAEALALRPDDVGLAIAFELAATAALLFRRRHAWLAAIAAMTFLIGMAYLGPEVDELATPILVMGLAAFSVGRYLERRTGFAVVAVFAFAIMPAQAAAQAPFDVTDFFFVFALLAPPYLFGRVLRTLNERNEELLRLQEQVRDDAVSAERARIARELHDVIAHSVSAMVVQATAAEDLVRRDPALARDVMHDVAETGRRALAETGRLLHLIRDTDDEMGLAPDAGLERLGELVEQFRRSGLDVALDVEGSLHGLPAGVDVSAYRIVQEALTNALKHAPGQAARVHVRRCGERLQIDVENAGTRTRRGQGSGLGLVGMAERVEVFGGTLTHGFTDDDRFLLSAQLPLEPA